MMKKIYGFIFVLCFSLMLLTPTALAGQAGDTILPNTEDSVEDCKSLLNDVEMDEEAFKDLFTTSDPGDRAYANDILGCGIKTGRIKLWMIPYYVRYIMEFALRIGGLVAVGGIIAGGYMFMFSSMSEDKDRGKKALTYSLSGLVLMMLAWAIVNIVISVLTL